MSSYGKAWGQKLAPGIPAFPNFYKYFFHDLSELHIYTGEFPCYNFFNT